MPRSEERGPCSAATTGVLATFRPPKGPRPTTAQLRRRFEEVLVQIEDGQKADGALGEGSPRGMLSDDSKKLYRRFIYGYTRAAGGASSPSKSAERFGPGSGVHDIVGEVPPLSQEEKDRIRPLVLPRGPSPASRPTSSVRVRSPPGEVDHYEYFAQLASVATGGYAEESDKRLTGRRLLSYRQRVVIRARSPSSKAKKAAPPAGEGAPTEQLEVKQKEDKDAKRPADSAEIMDKSSPAAAARLKAEIRKREACESLRWLTFGTGGGGGAGKHHGKPAHEQNHKCGTFEEVQQLHKVWTQMDEDGSGDVEFEEFLKFFSRSKTNRVLGMRCVNYLMEQKEKEGAGGDEPGCTVIDMMKLLWLKTDNEDIQKMMHWFCEFEFELARVPTPPLISKRRKREILENFPAVMVKGRQQTFGEILDTSLIDEETVRSLREQHGINPMDPASEEALLEMLCPKGYRAHKDVKTAIDKLGRPLTWTSNEFFTGWLVSGKELAWRRDPEFGFVRCSTVDSMDMDG